jgi:hypothetical protein
VEVEGHLALDVFQVPHLIDYRNTIRFYNIVLRSERIGRLKIGCWINIRRKKKIIL